MANNNNINTQTSGTCWWHATMNPFFLSPRLAVFLYKALGIYIDTKIKKKEHLIDFMKPQAPSCINFNKTHSRVYFMKKLWSWLYYGKGRILTNNRNAINKSHNAIKNILGRNFRTFAFSSQTTGEFPLDHIDTLFSRIGFKDFSMSNLNINNINNNNNTVIKDFIVKKGSDNTKIISKDYIYTKQHISYDLDSAVIRLNGINSNRVGGVSHSAHEICGYKKDGKYYIRDSNMKSSIECDWRNVNNILTNSTYINKTKIIYGANAQWINSFFDIIYYVSQIKYSIMRDIARNDVYKININNLKERINKINISEKRHAKSLKKHTPKQISLTPGNIIKRQTVNRQKLFSFVRRGPINH